MHILLTAHAEILIELRSHNRAFMEYEYRDIATHHIKKRGMCVSCTN